MLVVVACANNPSVAVVFELDSLFRLYTNSFFYNAIKFVLNCFNSVDMRLFLIKNVFVRLLLDKKSKRWFYDSFSNTFFKYTRSLYIINMILKQLFLYADS